MLLDFLWVGVCTAALSLDQNVIENVLILINYYAGPRSAFLIQYARGPHQRHMTDGYTLI